ncbi:hypothetical protein FB45DRAFT_862609 [Roridomyces roridus]|uniref:Transmembrane protein n=1 Tax=Roridomyces roridus TaxID=1738132 RepID=A0AAD7C846_9AGAR|nr:hypothetical protein FB45DRAFT_862609 [Roridomyces roridus]
MNPPPQGTEISQNLIVSLLGKVISCAACIVCAVEGRYYLGGNALFLVGVALILGTFSSLCLMARIEVTHLALEPLTLAAVVVVLTGSVQILPDILVHSVLSVVLSVVTAVVVWNWTVQSLGLKHRQWQSETLERVQACATSIFFRGVDFAEGAFGDLCDTLRNCVGRTQGRVDAGKEEEEGLVTTIDSKLISLV